MDAVNIILEAMKKGNKPMSAGQIVESTGLDRKEVDKVMKKMKTEGKIVSPIRCYWEPVK